MIIAIALHNNTLNSPVHLQFGRCPFFAIYNGESDKVTYLENTEKDSLKDTGIAVASMLLSKAVSAVVAGRFGVKAADYLREKQVQMILPHRKDTTLADILKKVNPHK
ncbi:NifB/NifX family molybdenum-iron cluster-binding protein [Arcticibacter tournemirensis]